MPEYQVWLGWKGAMVPDGAAPDPRVPVLMALDGRGRLTAGHRCTAHDRRRMHTVRIAAGVPQGPVDLQPERALMLEAGLDKQRRRFRERMLCRAGGHRAGIIAAW